jgi:hypothetical protein
MTRTVPAILLCAALLPTRAFAGFAESLPRTTFLLDVAYNYSWLRHAWDDDGNKGPLVAPIERFEPGGGKQGTLIPDADVRYQIVLFQLQYGILDNLSVGLGMPLVVRTSISPDLKWIPGDFQPQLGRPYGEEDFWQWAGSMGQPRPGDWVGNRGVPGDLVLGARLRWSDWIPAFGRAGLSAALTVSAALPTGRHADPEEVVSAGTTMWDLQTQGDLTFHLGFDQSFGRALDDRLVVGVEGFYEVFLPRRYATPAGTRNPLLLNFRPYVGASYILDPGDYAGVSVLADVAAIRGPARASRISGHDAARAEAFPALVSLSVRYSFTHVGQTRYASRSDLWDYSQEDHWRPGYKNALAGTAMLSLLRLGVPLQVYASFRTLSLIPGRNVRAADAIAVGVRVPAKLW